jgi:hypothetical protein
MKAILSSAIGHQPWDFGYFIPFFSAAAAALITASELVVARLAPQRYILLGPLVDRPEVTTCERGVYQSTEPHPIGRGLSLSGRGSGFPSVAQ